MGNKKETNIGKTVRDFNVQISNETTLSEFREGESTFKVFKTCF